MNNPKYTLDENGCFNIENYNQAKLFSNFFPGIAGLWGIPMWVFYVNRGQCVTSFGIEAKDKAIMEFQPANKAYRQTALQGFRTFIKVKIGPKTRYYEPFQNHLEGTDYKKKVKLSMSAHDLTLEEENLDLGIIVRVNYFTLAEEPFAALIRRVSIINVGKQAKDIEVIDGLPVIVPYGLTDALNKNISRTVEAWVKVRNLKKKAAYYQLNVEVSDKPEVTPIEEGNFYFSFDPQGGKNKLLEPIVENACVFGAAQDFVCPQQFIEKSFSLPKVQQTSNRSPSAMSYFKATLKPKATKEVVSMLGYAHDVDALNDMVKQATQKNYIDRKSKVNKGIIDEVKNYCLTKSSLDTFDKYCSSTFLDNILRGGLPVTIGTKQGDVAFNVYSRKHGDLERDYNYFYVAASYYSQGNGNYRDVNQNRRNDAWFNPLVGDSHIMTFLNLSQADGYNPLVVQGVSFKIQDQKYVKTVLNQCVEKSDHKKLTNILEEAFLPGELLTFIAQESISLKVTQQEFLSRVLQGSKKQELSNHGEGFWSDHWTYNLDLLESYLALYPEKLRHLLMEKEEFYFYHNDHYVLPRDQRYILTERGVRQYESVKDGTMAIGAKLKGNRLKVKNGEGGVYYTHLVCKLLCLIANKVASLDPSGVGVEMEADKPNWYDSLNGLPGLLGSSISETIEIKRYSQFLLESLKQLGLADNHQFSLFEELYTFVTGLSPLLSLKQDPKAYWQKSNDIKEHYRNRIRLGVDGVEEQMTVAAIKTFLIGVIEKINTSIDAGFTKEGFLSTYFYHQVPKYQELDKSQNEEQPFVRPLEFKRHNLPLFLEGYVHALRVAKDVKEAKELYSQVRRSPLFDKKLKMYKVNENLANETDEIGRCRIFPSGWLENESVWLHMEYKFMLEVLRQGLYEEFFDNFKHVLVSSLDPAVYGRSTLENSSFIVSSAHEDASLHGQGFVARLSGSTAEFLHMWLLMNVGLNPFSLNANQELVLSFVPALPSWLFTTQKSTVEFYDIKRECFKEKIDQNCYAFVFLGSTLVVYHNPKKKNTYGKSAVSVQDIELTYSQKKKPVLLKGAFIPSPYSGDIRDGKLKRIDVHLG